LGGVDGIADAGDGGLFDARFPAAIPDGEMLEGLVFADRIGSLFAGGIPDVADPVELTGTPTLVSAHERSAIQQTMTDDVGVLRSDSSMSHAQVELSHLRPTIEAHTGAWETSNVSTVAALITAAARERTETRGSHWREDFPDRDDKNWLVRIDAQRDPDGQINLSHRKVLP